MLGKLAKAVDTTIETLCVSPDYPEPGTEADAEGDAAVPGLLKGLKYEEELLRDRSAAIQRRGREILEDLRGREKQLHERMDAMLGKRFRAEMEAVKALTNEIKSRIESCDRLMHELKLQVSDFVKDEDSLTYALEPAQLPLPAREELPPFCLSTAQLARMVAWLKTAGTRSVHAGGWGPRRWRTNCKA